MKQKIIFFGSGSYVLPIIEALNNKFKLTLVITTETDGVVPKFCKSNSISFISVRSSSEIINNLQSIINCRVAVLTSFGLIIPGEILNMFPLGIINIHPSLLPKYRGPTPVQTAILNGDEKTGVSIIKLDSEVDHGPILVKEEVKIEPTDTSETLYKKLFELGSSSIVQIIEPYIRGDLKPVEQDHSRATFTEHLTRESGFIELSSKDLKIGNWKLEIARKIRAYYPWPGVWFRATLNGVERTVKLLPDGPLAQIQVEGADQSRSEGSPLASAKSTKTSVGSLEKNQTLGIRIQVEGKRPMLLVDFANGYPEGKSILEKLGFND